MHRDVEAQPAQDRPGPQQMPQPPERALAVQLQLHRAGGQKPDRRLLLDSRRRKGRLREGQEIARRQERKEAIRKAPLGQVQVADLARPQGPPDERLVFAIDDQSFGLRVAHGITYQAQTKRMTPAEKS